MVYMVIYQAHDGLWHVWDSPLAEHQLAWSVAECLRANGDDTPIKVVWATDTEMLGVVLKDINQHATIHMPAAQECDIPPPEGLLPEPRPYSTLSQHDKRRLDIENGPGGDVDTRERYRPSDEDLVRWSVLLAKYRRGELQS